MLHFIYIAVVPDLIGETHSSQRISGGGDLTMKIRQFDVAATASLYCI
jgi:hypothetical protein